MQQRSNIRCIVHEFPTNTTKYKIDSSIDLGIKRKKNTKTLHNIVHQLASLNISEW